MAGAIVMVVVLAIFPLLVGIGAAPIAALLGVLLHKDRESAFEGSEVLAVNR